MTTRSDTWHNLPPLLAGWRWKQNDAGQARLVAPDGQFETKDYTYNSKAIAEALRYVHSQPRPLAEQSTVEALDQAVRSGDTAALAQIEPPVLGVAMMDAEEAREYVAMMRTDLTQIDNAIGNFRARALDFKEREGWRALGYAGYLEAINAELGTQYSKSYLSRLLKAAEIERVLELSADNSVPTKPLRTLAESELDSPTEQRAAWDRATQIAGGATPTSPQVQQAVEEIKPSPARPDAPEGWVWRDNNSLRRIADAQIVGPYARLADAVTAAEVMDRERAHAAQQQAKSGPPNGDPTTDAGRVASIRRYLDAANAAGRIYDRTTFDLAFDLAHEIYDGDTYRSIAQEIHDRTNGGMGAPKPEAPPAPAAPLRPAIDWRDVSQLAYHLGALRDQAQAWETWQRIGHALVLNEPRIFANNLLRMLSRILDHEGIAAEAWADRGYALIEQIGQAAAVPTLESEGIAADSPLDTIAAALATIEAWATRHPDADAEEIRINLAELREAERLLEDLSAADAIDTDAWERLSHTRGELEVLLRERLEHRQAVGV